MYKLQDKSMIYRKTKTKTNKQSNKTKKQRKETKKQRKKRNKERKKQRKNGTGLITGLNIYESFINYLIYKV